MAIISDRSIKGVQLRVKNEEFNSKQYTAMSNWLSIEGYEGASKVWTSYAADELVHKGWAVRFLLDLNILPIESSQEQPQTEFKGLPQIIALTYQIELNTTNEVRELAKIALEDGDTMTFGLAQQYIKEQVEEIAKVQQLVDELTAFGTDKIALRLMDEKMKG